MIMVKKKFLFNLWAKYFFLAGEYTSKLPKGKSSAMNFASALTSPKRGLHYFATWKKKQHKTHKMKAYNDLYEENDEHECALKAAQ